jgi:hypothetical protein
MKRDRKKIYWSKTDKENKKCGQRNIHGHKGKA